MEDLIEHFSYKVPGAEYTWAFKHGGWNGRTSMIKEDLFLTGILERVVTRLIKVHSIQPELVNKTNIKPVEIKATDVPLRQYQFDAISSCFRNTVFAAWFPRGIIEVATGGGKTEIAVAMYLMTQTPTVCLVHRKHLVEQMRKRFEKYGVETGVIAEGKFEPNYDGVTVATFQTLQQKLWKAEPHPERTVYRQDAEGKSIKVRLPKYTPSQKEIDEALKLKPLFDNTKQLFLDECHTLANKLDSGNEFIKVTSQFTEAFMRWGLSATPFMKDDYSNMLLEGATGKSLYKIRSKDLIDKGYLSPIKIKFVKHNSDNLLPKMKWLAVQEEGIVENKIRNHKIIETFKEADKPCFIMVNRTKHAKNLQEIAESEGLDIPILNGKSSTAQRFEVLDEMAVGNLDGCIVTTIFDDGVDLPELRSGIFAGGGKAKTQTLQRIGRYLRPCEGKEYAMVYDMEDLSHRLLKKHTTERKSHYREQELPFE